MSIRGITGATATNNHVYTGTANESPEQDVDFSSMLAEAMKEEMTRMGVTAGADASGIQSGYMPMQMESQGIETMLLTAASSGEITDSQAALFMLCMMMQSSGDSDSSMLMQMMSSMLTQIQGEADSSRYTAAMSGYDPYSYDAMYGGMLNTYITGLSGTGQAILPTDFWRPVIPAITSSEENRNPELYRSVISQFRVETAERYRPFRNGSTYCNIFMWDVTCAMGAEIPHYTDYETGRPRFYPDVSGAKAMTAVEIDGWLKTYGDAYGWRQVDAETAQRYANEGKPAVTTGGSLDHVQVVCPSKNGEYDPVKGVTIAQAGSKVTSYAYISSIYGNSLDKISYFVHE